MFDSVVEFVAGGLLQWQWWQVALFALASTHVTIASVTIYLHRYSSHRALELSPVLKHFFRFWLYMTSGMNTKEWTAIHRKHHAKCETENDPHSPQVKGLPEVFWRGSELYRAEAKNQETLSQYGAGCPDDWLENNVYTPRSTLGVSALMVIYITLFGGLGLTVWAVQMVWIPVFAAGIINGIGHYFGYRNYECADASRNISPWGILIGGEELHNNHHTYPNSARLSNKWWEFDIGWFYIRLFEILGLAQVKKVAPKAKFDFDKAALDIDSLRGVVSNRFQVMARYRKEVIVPAVRSEKAKAEGEAKRLFAKAKKLLSRDESLLTFAAKQRREALLAQSEMLEAVHEYRLRLQQIWSQTSRSGQEMCDELKQWCVEAEESGIKALEDFAQTLRAYMPQPAM